ncbi:MAG: Acyltransferase 3 [Bacilli bacterium]|nr:Acyltransferase 3 [Bacilli bacterium]
MIASINDHLNLFALSRTFSFGISSAFIILGAVTLEKTKNINSSRILVYLGNASYSIYLVHFPAIALVFRLMQKTKMYAILGVPLASTLLLIVSLIIGCLVHSIIEKPMLAFFRSSKSAAALSRENHDQLVYSGSTEDL